MVAKKLVVWLHFPLRLSEHGGRLLRPRLHPGLLALTVGDAAACACAAVAGPGCRRVLHLLAGSQQPHDFHDLQAGADAASPVSNQQEKTRGPLIQLQAACQLLGAAQAHSRKSKVPGSSSISTKGPGQPTPGSVGSGAARFCKNLDKAGAVQQRSHRGRTGTQPPPCAPFAAGTTPAGME